MRFGTRRRLIALALSVAAAGAVTVAGVAAAAPSSPTASSPTGGSAKSPRPGPSWQCPRPTPTSTKPGPQPSGKKPAPSGKVTASPLPGGKKPAPPPDQSAQTEAMSRDLARILGIPLPTARTAIQQLMRLSDQQGGLDPCSAGFARIARGLGITPQRLQDALVQVKVDLGKLQPVPSGKPTGK
jgi:hypothetical protein